MYHICQSYRSWAVFPGPEPEDRCCNIVICGVERRKHIIEDGHDVEGSVVRHPKAGLVVSDRGIYGDLDVLYVIHFCTIRGWGTEWLCHPWERTCCSVGVHCHHFLFVDTIDVRGSKRLDAPRQHTFLGYGRLA
jgi:hypothetical protein